MELEPFDWGPERTLLADVLEKLGIPVGPLAKYAEAVRERRIRRAGELIHAAAAESGEEPSDFLEAVGQMEELGDLLAEALEVAATSRSSGHIRALARVLAMALGSGNSAAVDSSYSVVRALRRLDPVDVRALHALETTGPRAMDEELLRPFDVIREELGSDELASPVEHKLLDLALINPGIRFDEERRHIVTPFGRQVLHFLRDHPR